MIFQLIDPSATWIIVLALIFGMSLFMTFLTDKETDTFFVFLTIFTGFGVWSGLLDLWLLIVCIIIITLLIIMNVNKNEV